MACAPCCSAPAARCLTPSRALSHTLPLPARRRALLRRLDHACIVLMISGGDTPVAAATRTGGARLGLYVAFARLTVLVSAPAQAALDPAAQGVLRGGGRVCGVGTLAYSLRRPALWPRVFGDHDLVHLAVLVGSGAWSARG